MNKILIFAEIDETGGTRVFLTQLLNYHKILNYETILVLENNHNNNLSEFIENKLLKILKIKKRNFFFKKSYFSLFYEFFYYTTIIFKINPNLILSSTGTPGFNFALFFFNKPFIYFLHSYPSKPGILSYFFLKIPSFYTNNKKKIIVVSEYLKKQVINNWRINEDYITVIYNSYRININKTFNYNDKLTVLTVGHVTSYKNPLLWIDIAKYIVSKYKNINFIWAGNGDLLDQCRSLVANYNKISFIGHQDNIQNLYIEADIYMQLSIIESLGMGVVDAVSAGLPSIVTNVGGLPEIINHNFNGFLINNTNEAISCLEKLILNKEQRYYFSNNSFSIRNKFSPENQTKKINFEYNKLINYK